MTTPDRTPVHHAPAASGEAYERAIEPSLRDLLDTLWGSKWLILSLTLFFSIAGGVTAAMLPKSYQATVVISPVSDELAGGRLGSLNSLISQFGGLASLASVPAASTMRAESIATLQSISLTERFIQENDLLPILYADLWDARTGKWRTSDPGEVPTLWKANEFFRKHVRAVVENKKSGLVNLTITWKDPVLAAKWANDLVALANDYLRSKAIHESERNLAYLREQSVNTSIVEVQKAIYSLMEAEIRKAMLAKGNEEYALKVIDRAVAPEEPSSPRPVLWIAAGFFVGLLLSVTCIFVYRALKRER